MTTKTQACLKESQFQMNQKKTQNKKEVVAVILIVQGPGWLNELGS